MAAVTEISALQHATGVEAAKPKFLGDARHHHNYAPGLVNVLDLYPTQKPVFSQELHGKASMIIYGLGLARVYSCSS